MQSTFCPTLAHPIYQLNAEALSALEIIEKNYVYIKIILFDRLLKQELFVSLKVVYKYAASLHLFFTTQGDLDKTFFINGIIKMSKSLYTELEALAYNEALRILI